MAMSEADPGTPWPPEPEEEVEPESDSSDQDGTPDKYVPDHLAEHKVSLTSSGGVSVSLGSTALKSLYVVPGDRVRVYDHPDGILIAHAEYERGDRRE